MLSSQYTNTSATVNMSYVILPAWLFFWTGVLTLEYCIETRNEGDHPPPLLLLQVKGHTPSPPPPSFWSLSPPSPAPILTFTASLCAWVLQEHEEAPTLHWERNHGLLTIILFLSSMAWEAVKGFVVFPLTTSPLLWHEKSDKKMLVQCKMFGCKGKNIPPVPFQLSPARAALPCTDQTIICSFIHRAEGKRKKKEESLNNLVEVGEKRKRHFLQIWNIRTALALEATELIHV